MWPCRKIMERSFTGATCELRDRTQQLIALLQDPIRFKWNRRWILVSLGGFHIRCNEERTCKATLRAGGPRRQQRSLAPLHKTEQLPECSLTLAEITQALLDIKTSERKLKQPRNQIFGFDPKYVSDQGMKYSCI